MDGRYYSTVTLSARRRTYWLLFALSLAFLAASILLAVSVLQVRGDRPAPAQATEAIFGLHLPSSLAAMGGGIAAAAGAAALLFYVLISFRKTNSSEILYFSFWVLSLAFESGRIAAFGMVTLGWTADWSAYATRFVLTARFTGYGCLFLAGLHAAGFRSEEPGRSVALIAGIGLALATSLPLDSGSWLETLILAPGYPKARLLLLAAIALGTAANFAVAAKETGEWRFLQVAGGVLMLFAGQELLASQWRLEWMFAGILLLAAGARLFVSRLHEYYLWQ